MSQITTPERVKCSGHGLEYLYYKHPVYVRIDARKAGPGELKAFCEGKESRAACELESHGDSTFTLKITAQEHGSHMMYITYNKVHVPGSPFCLMMSPASFVELSGPGLQDGFLMKTGSDVRLSTESGIVHKGEFSVTAGKVAGQADITVRVGGSNGDFNVKTRREGRTLHCRYHPRDPGHYIIQVKWGDHEVPGSPCKVYVAPSEHELKRYSHKKNNHS